MRVAAGSSPAKPVSSEDMADASLSPTRFERFGRYWRRRVVGSVSHVDVNDRVHDDAGFTARYLFMTMMSAGIAVLGLLLSSPAVVIGAMLISPLMGPIIGLGFALATADASQIRRAAVALIAGSVFAVLFCAAIVVVSPLQNVTSEIAARTRPNLFDLVIALFSALAGTYATIRGRAGTIVGVAIATALMPPLATVGFGLATWNATVFLGSLLLFVTNFVTIAMTAAVLARFYGFGPRLSPHQTVFQTIAIIVVVAALAVPLGLSLRRIAWEGLAGRQAQTAVSDTFGEQARISQIDLDFHSRPIKLTATVLTPHYRTDANRAVAAAFQRAAGQPVTVSIEQYRVGTGSADAEVAAIKAAEATSAATPGVDAATTDLVGRLALVAGVDPGRILVDQPARRVRVIATPLPEAGIATYHALELRVAAAAPGWQVALVPPAVPLAAVTFDGDAPDELGRATLASATWGARRLGLGIDVTGPTARTTPVVTALTDAGIAAKRTGGGTPVRLTWAVPPAIIAATPIPTPTPTAPPQ